MHEQIYPCTFYGTLWRPLHIAVYSLLVFLTFPNTLKLENLDPVWTEDAWSLLDECMWTFDERVSWEVLCWHKPLQIWTELSYPTPSWFSIMHGFRFHCQNHQSIWDARTPTVDEVNAYFNLCNMPMPTRSICVTDSIPPFPLLAFSFIWNLIFSFENHWVGQFPYEEEFNEQSIEVRYSHAICKWTLFRS